MRATPAAVDQIESAADAPRRPPRPRRDERALAAEPLVVVETAPEKIAAIVATQPVENEPPRPRAPRPRRERNTVSEPLIVVDTVSTRSEHPPQ